MQDQATHTETIGKYKIEIYQDTDSMNPVTDYDHGCSIVMNYSDYKRVAQQATTDKSEYSSVQEVLNEITGRDTWEEELYNEETDEYHDNPEQPTPPENVVFVMVGQYGYYGGISWSRYTREELQNMDEDDINRAECVLWITREDITREKLDSDEDAVKCCKAVAQELDDYSSGNVYGYTVTDTDTDEDQDSCWGFIGDYDTEGGCLDQARDMVKYYQERDEKATNFVNQFYHT